MNFKVRLPSKRTNKTRIKVLLSLQWSYSSAVARGDKLIAVWHSERYFHRDKVRNIFQGTCMGISTPWKLSRKQIANNNWHDLHLQTRVFVIKVRKCKYCSRLILLVLRKAVPYKFQSRRSQFTQGRPNTKIPLNCVIKECNHFKQILFRWI